MDENKDLEKRLEESDARFRSYFNLPLVGIAITSPNKGWIEVNDKVCSMIGYTREEILKKTWAEMTHPEDLIIDENLFNKLMSGEINQYNIDKRYIRKDNTFFWTNLSVGCVKKPNGEIDYLIAIIIDITERKEMEKKINDQNSLMMDILENSPIGFAVNKIDDGEIIFTSNKFKKIYDIENKNINNVSDFFENIYKDPNQRENIHNKINDNMKSGDPLKMKWEGLKISTSNGDKYITASNILVPEQNLIISTVQDVTEQKLKDESLQEKMEELEKMNRLMIGRELKMAEIKEEDQILKEQITKQSI